ncbi:MAG TPA: hypothetical protein VFX03_00865, partial [Thermomicrobiales bacterium]|nr:hypothetical protein [Thermomicrobiales bacterium]
TPTGLEQATDQWIAAYKAERFSRAGRVADLCCGIGGDLLSLTARTRVLGVDRDEIAALFARTNLEAVDRSSDESPPDNVLCSEIAQIPLDGISAWHIDPDRRPHGRRTTRVELHEPGMPEIERLLAACPAGSIKLAPAAALPERWSSEAELEWISRGGECRQLVAWFGPLAKSPGMRRATIVKPNGANLASGERQPPDGPRSSAEQENIEVRSVVGEAELEIPPATGFSRFLAEPDAAVLAAKLTGVLAAERKLAAIAPGSVYLTGDEAAPDLALAWFEIADVLPFDVKRLKALLRERGCGRLEIKKRGVPHDPERVRRQLRVPGENAATVFITRVRGAVTAIVTQRINNADAEKT